MNYTDLITACELGHMEIVKLHLNKFKQRIILRKMALKKCVIYSRFDLFKLLWKISPKTKRGNWDLLNLAVRSGNLKVVKFLVKKQIFEKKDIKCTANRARFFEQQDICKYLESL